MSELDTYIRNATAAGVEVETLTAGELAGRVEALATKAEATGALVAGFEERPELRAAVEEGLRRAGVRLLNGEEAHLAELGVTLCETLVADTGSLSLTSGPANALTASLLPRLHLAVGRPVAVHTDLASLLASLAGAMPSRVALVTGPSRTGDIEATMTKCVHGPGRVVHLLLS